MLSEAVIALAVVVAIELIATGISALLNLWGEQQLPETAQAELSDVDKEKVKETQDLIKQCFGNDVTNRLQNASNIERIALMADFAEMLSKEYGLEIDVDVTANDSNNCGYYEWKQKKAVFNIALLMIDGNDERFEYYMRETIDTIVHELRHAVQHHAIEHKGFWNVDDKRRNLWVENMAPGNYIRADVDMRGYAEQPIEKDAVTFAAMVMEGVK